MFIRKRPYEEIEPAIKPLVNSLNAAQGISTIASCHGHWYGKPPYVYFKAPVPVVAAIARLLREDSMGDSPKLVGNWCVEGIFDGEYNLAFYLRAPDYHRGAESTFKSFWLFGIRRTRLNVELLTLTQLVEQAMHADIRDHGKPEIGDSTAYDK